jgi:hypothetical protein
MSSSQVAYLRASTISEAMARKHFAKYKQALGIMGIQKTHLQLLPRARP